jgi:hypothetical protein
VLEVISGWLWDLHNKYSENRPKGSGGPLLLGSKYITYCVLDWGYHGYWVTIFSARWRCMQGKERVDSLLCCTVGLLWLPGWHFNKMQDYKNKEWAEVVKILRTDTSEIETVVIDLKSVAVITEEFCLGYCVIFYSLRRCMSAIFSGF